MPLSNKIFLIFTSDSVIALSNILKQRPMVLEFRIHYYTRYGENLFIQFQDLTGFEQILPMLYVGDGYWEYLFEETQNSVNYRYVFQNEGGHRVPENQFRHIENVSKALVLDTWRSPSTPANALYSGAFTQAVFNHPHAVVQPEAYAPGQLVIRLREIRLGKDEAFCIMSRQFGDWDTAKAHVMSRQDDFVWEYVFDHAAPLTQISYKFGIWDTAHHCFKMFEDGNDHVALLPAYAGVRMLDVDGFRYGNFWRGAGVAVPVFSLRTTQSMGCGEFSDLKPLADWCEACGLKMIQLLPINDTIATQTWVDTYPYNAISVMAFHPMYLSVKGVYAYYNQPMAATSQGVELNQFEQMEYEPTMHWKMSELRALFEAQFKLIRKDRAFQTYYEQNKWWVADYAVFSLMRDRYKTPDFRTWDRLSVHHPEEIQQILNGTNTDAQTVWFYIFLQFHLELQLTDAIAHAHSKRIAFKGDLPIGINPNSVEAWVEPSLFNFGLQAGAPPDFFSASGQNWGFPTYNWEEMKLDGYAWWQRRLGRMQQFFDAFRIDHILGFFRIWSIPKPFTDGMMGYFDPALPMHEHELKQFGYMGNPEYFSVPVTDRDYLNRLFGAYAESIDQQLFVPTGYQHRRMRPECFTPVFTAQWTREAVLETDRDWVNVAFHVLMREILFIPAGNNHWHPRIMMPDSRLFSQMSWSEQEVLRRIHNHYYYERHNEFWKYSALERLRGTLNACSMLVFGEDLGMIPASVPEVMQQLQILSLEIQRMPKKVEDRYGNTWTFPYMSVCTPSSHDISSLRGWWEENYDERAYFYYHILHRSGPVPYTLQHELASHIVELQLQSPSMWCVIPLQDFAAMDPFIPKLEPALERINEPANPKHYWRYRVPFHIDELIQKYPVHRVVHQMVNQSGR